jgi:hypothetical protein
VSVRGSSSADFHQWPNAAGAGQLPNASGSATQSSALEQGDLCYDSNNGVMYICLFATLGSAVWVPVSTQVDPLLFKWNNSSLSQFSPPTNIGSPVNPTLAYVAEDTEATNELRLSLDDTTPAGAGAIWWINTIVAWQSMCVEFFCREDGALPATDAYEVCVVMAGDAGAETCIRAGVGATAFQLAVEDGSATTSVQSRTLAASAGGARKVRLTLNCATQDAATFPPFGVPTLIGTVECIGDGNIAQEASVLRLPAGPDFNAPPWGTTGTNRIGIALVAPAGVVDPGGLNVRISGLTFTRNALGTP